MRWPKRLALLLALGVLARPAVAEPQEVSLEQALALFLKNNYDIIIHKYEVDKAYADFVGAKLLPNPSLSLDYTNIQFGRGGIYAGDNTQWTVRLDQLIEIGGKRGLRKSVATDSLEAAKLGHQDVIRSLLIGFYTLYYDILLDELNVGFARDEMAGLDKLLTVSNMRYSAGFLTEMDWRKLKLSRISLENDLARYENQYDNDLELFNALLGVSPRVKPAASPARPAPTDYDADALVKTALQNRYDLLSLQKQLEAARASVRLAKANGKPDLTVGAEYDSLGPRNDPAFGVGLSINLPLFNRNQKEIMVASYAFDQLKTQIDKTKREIEAEVRRGLNNYRSSFKIFNSYSERHMELDDLLEKSRQAFALGGITALDVIDTQKTYRDFMSRSNQALVQCLLDEQLLKIYAGGTP